MADKKISEFPNASSLTHNEYLPLVQDGINKKVDVKTLLSGSINLTAGTPEGGLLPVGTIFSTLCSRDYNLTGWRLWVSPAGSLTLSVRKTAFSSIPPTSGDKISGTGGISVSSGTTAQSDSLTGWTNTVINKTDAISVIIDANSGVKWFSLELLGG